MYMQIRLPLACFLIIIYAFIYYEQQKKLNTKSAEIFEAMIYSGIIHVASSIVTEYTVNNRDMVPEWFNYIWHLIYLISLTCACFFIAMYVIQYIELASGKRKKKETHILVLVCAVGILLELVLPISYIDTEYGSYSLGPKAYALYCVVIYVIISMIINLIVNRKIIAKEKSNVVIASIAIFVGVSLVQIIFPHILLTGFAITLIMLGFIMNTEDSNLYFDPDTKLFNKSACELRLKELVLYDESFRIGIYTFFGGDEEIVAAMQNVKRRITKINKNITCAVWSGAIMLVMPPTGTVSSRLPKELPSVKSGTVKYYSSYFDFTGLDDVGPIYSQIAEYKKKNEEEALHLDELTGLLRRNAYVRRVNVLLDNKVGFAFLMVDVDNFKNINDTYGHDAGDEMLKYMADTFRMVLRSDDLLCRMGGDEFSIVIHGITDTAIIQRITERISDKLHNAVFTENNAFEICVSVGIKVHMPEEKTDFETLYKESDAALYEAKHQGKGRIVFKE